MLHPGQLRITILIDLDIYINERLLFFPKKLSKSAQYVKVQRQNQEFHWKTEATIEAMVAPNDIVKN